MRKLRRILVAILIGVTISVGAFAPGGAFAQKNDNRPPKETPRVVDKAKERDKPPPSNNNQSNSNRPKKP